MKIGVDGGGTKTELILVDRDGAVVARHLAPGCNPSVGGTEHARRTLTDALSTLLAEPRRRDPKLVIEQTLLCMAGSPPSWQEFAPTLTGFGPVAAFDDSLPVLELATQGRPGLVLHGGTGSFVAARGPDGRLHYAGGLGWRFGDPGSGYDLGRRAAARALLELQGWATPSGLSRVVADHTGLRDAGMLSQHLYTHPHPNRHLAALAPAVLRLAAAGDAAAQQLVQESAGELLDLATAVARKLFAATSLETLPAGVSGPILTHSAIAPHLAQRSPFPLRPLTDPPIEGIRRLLARGFGNATTTGATKADQVD